MHARTISQLAALTAFGALGMFGASALAKETHKSAVAMAAPSGVQAENSTVPGTVKLTWQPVKGVTEYIVASSRETMTSWQSVAVTKTPAYELVDLPEGTKYYFRVASNGKSGQGPWSAPVMLTTTISKSPMAALPRPVTLGANARASSR